MRNLPEIIREQRPSVEESLNGRGPSNCSRVVGGAVGNDPAREPVLDEAMASWSALLYFRAYGEQRPLILEDQLQGVYRLYERLAEKTDATGRRAIIATRFSMQPSCHQRHADVCRAATLLGEEKLLKALEIITGPTC